MALKFIKKYTECGPRYISVKPKDRSTLSTQAAKDFNLKAGSYISLAQDDKKPKKFYLITNPPEDVITFKLSKCGNSGALSINSAEFSLLVHDAFKAGFQNIKLLISETAEVIDGVKAYPLIYTDLI